ncbi:MAG TPA: prolipoprotein diacylglyceryl transferase family protein [Solirubrobacter sp.]|nr:prolipoprotein diacylglyceryl transferase family protein [Solirubrobacter sp.]
MQPELHFFGLTIQTFGLCLGAAFLVAGWMVARRLRELGRNPELAYEMVFAALVGGIVGAKLWYVAENGGPLFSGTGLVFYGGLIGGALAVIGWARYRGALDLKLVDAVAPSLAAAYAIGRIGCQLSGDGDYGKDWDGPWAMAYPNGTVPTTTPVHPTPVYELLAMGAFAYLLWRWRDRWQPGTLMAVYLIGAGLERFLVEFVRRNADAALGLTQPQLVAIASIVAGGVWLALQRTTSMRRRARHRESALSRSV